MTALGRVAADVAVTAGVTLLATALPPGRPRRVAAMLPPGGDKYRDLPKAAAFTPAMLQAHIAGRATYAVTLDHDALTHLGAIDVERDDPEDGRTALLCGLNALRIARIAAFAIAVNTPGGHAGGHLWAFYADANGGRVSAAAVRHQLLTIAADAELGNDGPPEVWPSGQVIRLPFGYHTRAQTRGTLITQAGERFDLDDPTALAAAIAYVRDLQPNPAPPIVPRITPATPQLRQRVADPTPTTDRLSVPQLIARFNADQPLDQLLLHYGGKRTSDGWACNCGVDHTHQTQLQLLDRGIVSYSTRCRWAPHLTERKATDAFGLFCIVEHGGDRRAALRALGQRYNPPARRRYDGPAPQELSAPQIAARAAEAARKRQTRCDEAATTRTMFEQRLRVASDLPERAIVVGMALLEIAGERDWCRPSVARIADTLNYSERTVQRALSDLETTGYITTTNAEGGKGTAIRTFLRVTAREELPDVSTGDTVPNHSTPVSPESYIQRDPSWIPDLACEGGAGEVEPVPQATAEPGGASYDPAADWTLQHPPARSSRYVHRAKLVHTLSRPPGDLGLRTAGEVVPIAAAPSARPDEFVAMPPRDPARAATYFRLLGAARKADAAGRRSQARVLRDRAAVLRDLVTPEEAAARGGVSAPALQALDAVSLPSPQQLDLWTTALQPADEPILVQVLDPPQPYDAQVVLAEGTFEPVTAMVTCPEVA